MPRQKRVAMSGSGFKGRSRGLGGPPSEAATHPELCQRRMVNHALLTPSYGGGRFFALLGARNRATSLKLVPFACQTGARKIHPVAVFTAGHWR